MPSPVRTPESMIARADSKNPATTCRGITSTGRPCRRALPAATLPASTAPDGHHSLYCWQHKDQALASAPAKITTTLQPLQERTSIDTLISRLGLNEQPPTQRSTKTSSTTRVSETEAPNTHATAAAPASSRRQPAKQAQEASFFQKLCCSSASAADEQDYLEVVRHKDRTRTAQTVPMPKASGLASSAASIRSQTTSRPSLAPPNRPRIQISLSSPTLTSLTSGGMLSVIPSTLPRTVASQLFGELSKPISPSDAAGYIYIFWMTPSTSPSPSDDLASALLASNPPSVNVKRRQKELLKPFTNDARDHQSAIGAPTHGKLLLKIGRTTNVHRRMNEWSKQCGYNLSLLRWYPYTSVNSGSQPQPSSWRPRSLHRASAPPPVLITQPPSPDRTPLHNSTHPTKSAMKSETPAIATSTDSSSVSGSLDGSGGSAGGTNSMPPSSQTSMSTAPEEEAVEMAPKKLKKGVSFSGSVPPDRTDDAPAVPMLPLAYQQIPVLNPHNSPYLPPIPTTATPFGPPITSQYITPPGLQSGANSIRSVRTARTTRSGMSTAVYGRPAPRRIPHAHRTERLIHIELAEKRAAVGKCAACGREHREWFEVEASRDGVREVDEVVRRWVELDMV